MATPLTHAQIQAARLVPAASINRPISWFKQLGVAFEADLDDLDASEFAALRTASGVAFGLQRYEQGSAGETTLLLPRDLIVPPSLHAAIEAVAQAFALEVRELSWVSLAA
jgi:hypothetical protein